MKYDFVEVNSALRAGWWLGHIKTGFDGTLLIYFIQKWVTVYCWTLCMDTTWCVNWSNLISDVSYTLDVKLMQRRSKNSNLSLWCIQVQLFWPRHRKHEATQQWAFISVKSTQVQIFSYCTGLLLYFEAFEVNYRFFIFGIIARCLPNITRLIWDIQRAAGWGEQAC